MVTGEAPRLKRWTLDEYRSLVAFDAIGARDRVEFIEGDIVEKMGARPPHSNTVAEIGAVLAALFGPGFHVREEKPLAVEASEPEPDLAVIAAPRSRFYRRHPGADETALLVEVADTSLVYDRERKAALYARGGVPEYWIVDLNARRLIVHRGPLADGGWEEVRVHPETARVAPLGASGEVAIADVLPPPEATEDVVQ